MSTAAIWNKPPTAVSPSRKRAMPMSIISTESTGALHLCHTRERHSLVWQRCSAPVDSVEMIDIGMARFLEGETAVGGLFQIAAVDILSKAAKQGRSLRSNGAQA